MATNYYILTDVLEELFHQYIGQGQWCGYRNTVSGVHLQAGTFAVFQRRSRMAEGRTAGLSPADTG